MVPELDQFHYIQILRFSLMHVVCSGLRSVLSLSHFLISCNLLHYIEVADIRLLALGRRIEFFPTHTHP